MIEFEPSCPAVALVCAWTAERAKVSSAFENKSADQIERVYSWKIFLPMQPLSLDSRAVNEVIMPLPV